MKFDVCPGGGGPRGFHDVVAEGEGLVLVGAILEKAPAKFLGGRVHLRRKSREIERIAVVKSESEVEKDRCEDPH